MKIDLMTGIENLTLIVFYTSADYWQFAVITANRKLHQPHDIFYSPKSAEREGRQWIKVVLG